MPKLTPNLWFDTDGKEAAEFFTSLSELGDHRHQRLRRDRAEGGRHRADGRIVLDGQRYTAINGDQIRCADQDEVDYYWAMEAMLGVKTIDVAALYAGRFLD